MSSITAAASAQSPRTSPELNLVHDLSPFIGWLESVAAHSKGWSTDDQTAFRSLALSIPPIPHCECSKLLQDIAHRVSRAGSDLKIYDFALYSNTQKALTDLKAEFPALRTPTPDARGHLISPPDFAQSPKGSSSPTFAGKFAFKPIH